MLVPPTGSTEKIKLSAAAMFARVALTRPTLLRQTRTEDENKTMLKKT